MYKRILLLVSILSFTPLTNAEERQNERLTISSEQENYLLSVPVSNIELLIPKGNLAENTENIGGSTSNLRYFKFFDNTKNLIISGWFEPAEKFDGIDAFWKREKEAIEKKAFFNPENISITKNNNWDVVSYDINIQGYTQFNIKAELIQAGTWLDIHISTIGRNLTETQRSEVFELLKSLIVREK